VAPVERGPEVEHVLDLVLIKGISGKSQSLSLQRIAEFDGTSDGGQSFPNSAMAPFLHAVGNGDGAGYGKTENGENGGDGYRVADGDNGGDGHGIDDGDNVAFAIKENRSGDAHTLGTLSVSFSSLAGSSGPT
jgi:hypothetical protein